LRFWIAPYAQSVGCTSDKAGAANAGATAVRATVLAIKERININFLVTV
jgi:hypothetical protein